MLVFESNKDEKKFAYKVKTIYICTANMLIPSSLAQLVRASDC